MVICQIDYKGAQYAGVISPTFSGFRMYLKPTSVQAALLAELPEGVTPPEQFVDFAESDWVNARYRVDIESGVKFSTTLANRAFTGTLAVSYAVAYQQVHQARVRNSQGQYSREWEEVVQRPEIEAHLRFVDGLLSSGTIKNRDVSWVIQDIDESDADNLPPQLAIVYREAASKPLFNTLTKEAVRLYSLVNAYAGLCNKPVGELGLGIEKAPRTGYYSVRITPKTVESLAGVELLRFAVSKSPVNMGVYQTIEDVREAYPEKQTMWIENCQYEIVTDETLDSVMKELWDAPIISFDTETTGLRINFMSRTGLADELVGVCLSCKPETGYYFPVQHKLFENICGGDHWYFMQTYIKPLLESKPCICHNLSFDWKVAYIYDINVNCVFDTLLALGVTKRYEFTDYKAGLKEVCHNTFGIDMFEIPDFVIGEWEGSGITFADLPFDLVKHYGPADADITLRLYNWCKDTKLLEKYGAERVFNLEVQFAKVVAYSEFWGYHIDVAQLPALEEDVIGGMETEKAELFRLAGREFNPNSSVQLSKILYEELYPELIATGIVQKATTNKETLHQLDEYRDLDGNLMYPFVHHILEYRRYETTYKNFLKKKDEYISPDGYVFAGVQQLGTNTGRLSIKEPNYQSYNDVVKKRVCGRPGFYIFDCDFAQIEYRVLASMAGQDALIKAFDDPDLDYHTHQAARMFSVPYAAVSKQLRQQSKGINFGLPYGMGDESLGARIFGARTPENKAKAAELRRRFFEGQEQIQDFFTRVRNQGVSKGYTETWLGRRRYYHKDIFSEGSIRRQAGNHVVQGSAADIWKLAVTRLFNRVVKEDLLGKVLFNCFVHDELMGEVSTEIDPYEFIKMWREEYELSIEGFCRLYAGFGWGNSWYEAKKADYPPQFIETLVAKAGVDKSWDGDYKALIKRTKQELYEFEVKRVRDWYLESPRGTLLAPHIGGYLYDKLSDWWQDIIALDPDADNYALKKGKSGKPVASLDQVWKWFCLHEHLDFEEGKILPPDAAPSKAEPEAGIVEDDDETARLEQEHIQLVCQQTYTLGFYLDIAYSTLYLRYDKPSTQSAVNQILTSYAQQGSAGDVKLVLLSYDDAGYAQAFAQPYSLKYQDFQAVQGIVRMGIKGV